MHVFEHFNLAQAEPSAFSGFIGPAQVAAFFRNDIIAVNSFDNHARNNNKEEIFCQVLDNIFDLLYIIWAKGKEWQYGASMEKEF